MVRLYSPFFYLLFFLAFFRALSIGWHEVWQETGMTSSKGPQIRFKPCSTLYQLSYWGGPFYVVILFILQVSLLNLALACWATIVACFDCKPTCRSNVSVCKIRGSQNVHEKFCESRVVGLMWVMMLFVEHHIVTQTQLALLFDETPFCSMILASMSLYVADVCNFTWQTCPEGTHVRKIKWSKGNSNSFAWQRCVTLN